jgi:uncharacterized protein (DUF1786 family)
MQILSVDIGTGTQDIFLYDSNLNIENGFKLVVPAPTMIIHRRIKQATRRGAAILLDGVLMGGGPSQWAAEAHLRAGYSIYATPEAARSFNDDLEQVQALGIQVLSQDEALRLPADVERLELRDFDFQAIAHSLATFDVSLSRLEAVAVAVFDHGNAPPNFSDRLFRFNYLDERIRACNRLSAFAYLADQIPPSMTRLKSVALSANGIDAPLVVMDTAPAAVLGATFDPLVASQTRKLIANIGNFHTLAFRLGPGGIEGLFEHHTGLLDQAGLEALLFALAEGSLRHADVFDHHGHGALVYEPSPLIVDEGDFGVVVIGPRRNLLQKSSLQPYFAVPFGDMMIAGCFGLLSAAADLLPALAGPIQASLHLAGSPGAPWDAA